jgi:hypothetical protein
MHVPVYLSVEVEARLLAAAERQGITLDALVNIADNLGFTGSYRT